MSPPPPRPLFGPISCASVAGTEIPSRFGSPNDDGEGDARGGGSSAASKKWSYDRMAARPGMAEAFREFAWRALCQESVMFLEEVTK